MEPAGRRTRPKGPGREGPGPFGKPVTCDGAPIAGRFEQAGGQAFLVSQKILSIWAM
jgi:hypothetical protein